jgi:hypothetical protein
LQDQLAKRDLALDWAVNSCPLAWAKEAKARARVEELSLAMDNLQVCCNTLHEEVRVLYSQLPPNVPANPAGMEAGPSHVEREKHLMVNWTFAGPSLYEEWLTNGLLWLTVKLPKVKRSGLPRACNIGRMGLFC